MHIILTLIADDLWRRVRAVFARAQNAIGAPAAIAALRDLGESARRDIVARLAPLEAMVRKLLLVEATRFAADARIRVDVGAQRGAAPARQTSPHRRAQALDLAQPDTWPAQFSLAIPSDPRSVADHRAPRIRALWEDTRPRSASEHGFPDTRIRHPQSAFRLARRLEALRRVLDNPIPAARRLAHVLMRAIRRFPEIVRRYALAPATTGGYDPEDPRLAIECISRACDAEAPFSSG